MSDEKKPLDEVKEAAEKVEETVEAVAEKAEEAVESVKAAAGDAADAIEDALGDPAAKKKKWPVVLGICLVVAAIAFAGVWKWHEMPSFCNFFCHTGMDAYVETIGFQPGQAGYDKYGNEVSDANAMLVVSHAAQGKACLDCHKPDVRQQIGEVMETITGDYTVYKQFNDHGYYGLEEVSLEELQVNSYHEAGTGEQFCLNEACHNMTREDLTELTSSLSFNPHAFAHQNMATGEDFTCSDCHKSHRASVMVCTECHGALAEAVMPAGWVTAAQGANINPTDEA